MNGTLSKSGSVLRRLANSSLVRKSAAAFAIKILAAPLSYLMLVFVARNTTLEDFGLFSFAFALGIFATKFAIFGQNQMMMREIATTPAEETSKRQSLAFTGYRMALLGASVVGLALAIGGWLAERHEIIATAVFVAALAFSELQTSILRAHGSVTNAIAIREVVWRILLIGSVILAGAAFGKMNATEVMVLATALLAICTLLQAASHSATRFWAWGTSARSVFDRTWLTSSSRFLAISVVTAGTPALSTIIVGALQPIEQVGPFFAALKVAQLLSLVQIATNVVGAPLLARYYKERDLVQVQRICSLSVVASSVAALLGLIILFFFGGWLLNLFGETYAQQYPQLLMLAAGYVVTSTFGQNGQLLQMAGKESSFLTIMFVSNGLGLLGLIALTYEFGTKGAAASVLITFSIWNIWAWLSARKSCGVDTSIFSLITQRETLKL